MISLSYLLIILFFLLLFFVFFFFKQKTAYEMRISDWSSDVCSSDLQRIESARRDAGQAGHVGLLAVSKTQSADAIRALASAGQRAFGENYVQEAASKQDALREQIGRASCRDRVCQ